MIKFPARLELKVLDQEHPDYQDLLPVWERIYLLTTGGYRLEREAAKFIPQRIGEPPEIYRNRLKKFTYRNILGDALRHQVTRLSNGYVSVSSADETFWSDFRGNTNGKGRTEKDLISELFSTLLKYKFVYLQVDRPRALIVPRNQSEEEAIGNPYVVLHDPRSVINWGEDEDSNLTYVKLRTLTIDSSDPLAEPIYRATWTYITIDSIARYSAPVELDKKGRVVKVLGQREGELTQTVPLINEPIAHGLGQLPIVRVLLKDELWCGDQASSKAYEHLLLDCHKFDLLSAAYFQRIYKTESSPDSNLPGVKLSETYVGEEEEIQPGLEYVLKVENFEFKEPQGTILEHINNSLQRVEEEIEQLVDLTGASTEPGRGVAEQSGYAREFDFLSQKESLKAYGAVIVRALQDAYQLVERFRGKQPTLVVSGLDSFEIDDVNKHLAILQTIALIDFNALYSKLPPTLFTLLYEKLCLLLATNLPPEQLEVLKSEAESKTEFGAVTPQISSATGQAR